MQKTAYRLVAGVFVTWLRDRLPASGAPASLALAAECELLCVSLPDDLNVPDTLDEAGTLAALEWIFAGLARSHPGEHWVSIASHSLRLLALEHVSEITAMVAAPKTLDTQSVPAITQPHGG